MTNIINNPHDKFFRGVMHDINIARGFLELYMSEEAQDPLDLSTLTLKNTSAIDDELAESISDLVYSCEYKDKDKALGSARVIILVEHQSTPQKLMPFRVYHYLFNLLANEIKENDDIDLLPAVHGLVFYHGDPKTYPYSMKLADSFNDPHGIMESFWQKPVPLINVHDYDDDQLLSEQLQGFMSMALKHGREKEISEIWLQLIRAIYTVDFNEDIRLQFARTISSYLFSVGKVADRQKFTADINQLPHLIRGDMMTFADELREEGEARGEIRGVVKGVEDVAINGLTQKLPLEMLSNLTGLSIERIKQIKQEQGL